MIAQGCRSGYALMSQTPVAAAAGMSSYRMLRVCSVCSQRQLSSIVDKQ